MHVRCPVNVSISLRAPILGAIVVYCLGGVIYFTKLETPSNLEGQQMENGVIYGCNSAPVLLAASVHIVSSPDRIKLIKEEITNKLHNDAL